MATRAYSRDNTSWAETIQAGIIAGLIGGALMGLVAMVRSAAVGLGFWLPMKLISGLYFGVDTLLGDAGVILLGMLTHLVTASVWGVVFAVITKGRLRMASALLAGLLYGAAVWLVMTYFVLPWANEVMFERVSIAMGWFFVYHLVYGATLALSPGMARRLHRRHVGTPSEVPTPA